MLTRNALQRSCPHKIQESFLQQVQCLQQAGFPPQLVTSLAEALLRTIKHAGRDAQLEARNGADSPVKKRLAVIPYFHDLPHRLKKIGAKAEVNVVFSAPRKLLSFWRKNDGAAPRQPMCDKNHKKPFVPCMGNVVYAIPLKCRKVYVGQTGRCLNDRLREHDYNVNKVVKGHLGIHCRDCGCTPFFDSCAVIARHANQKTRGGCRNSTPGGSLRVRAIRGLIR